MRSIVALLVLPVVGGTQLRCRHAKRGGRGWRQRKTRQAEITVQSEQDRVIKQQGKHAMRGRQQADLIGETFPCAVQLSVR